MPTAATLKSLIGLLETEPQESKFEFIVEPNGDLFRTISSEDETNFYMENDTLPLDFNDIFEVNRVPSSFHGKIQATLGSIFQDCLLQNIGVDDKDIFSDILEVPDTRATELVCDEPVFMAQSEEVDETEFGNHTEEFKGEQSYNDIKETFLELESPSDLTCAKKKNTHEVKLEQDDVLGCLNVFNSDDENIKSEIGENINLKCNDIWNTFSEFENNLTYGNVSTQKETGPYLVLDHILALNKTGEDTKVEDTKVEDKMTHQDQMVESQEVEDQGLELNAWKCRLYRARRKRKLAKVSTDLDILEEDNKRLKLTHEKMLSNIQKIRKFYIQSIQQGSFNIKL